MEEAGSRKGERVAVKVELEVFPLNGAPIPPCRLQSIAITRGTEVGSFILYVGTESGHLLRYVLSSPIVQESSSFNSPSQTPNPDASQSLPPIPPLSLPPSPAPVTIPLGTSSSISVSRTTIQDPSPLPLPSVSSSLGTDASLPLVDQSFGSFPSAASLLPKASGRHRNGTPSPQFYAHSPIRQSQHSHSPGSPHQRPPSAPINASPSSRGSRQHQLSQISQSSSGQLSNQPTAVPRPASLPSSPASSGIPVSPYPLNFSPPRDSMLPGEHENGGSQTGHAPDTYPNSPSTRPSSPLLPGSVFLDHRVVASKTGVEMVLTVCKHVSKSPIETLCPLPECGRIAILSDGHIALLDWQSLNILDRLPGTKGAVTIARGLHSTLPIPYRSSFMVLEGLPEQKTRALARNDSMNKLFGRGRFTSKLGGLVGGLDKAFATGRGDVEGRRNGRPGRMGNVTGSARHQIDRLAGSSGLQDASANGKGLGRLAVAVKKKIILFEIRPSELEMGEDTDGLITRKDDSNGFYALKVREVTGIEGVVTMAWLGDVIIAGTRHEYLLFSLTSGLPTHLFSLPQELPWHPLLKAFPKNREALLLIDNAGIPINTEGHPAGSSLLFQILPDGIGYSPPYVLVAKQGLVEVYHHRTGSKMQSLLLTDGGKGRSLVADDEDGAFVVIANSFKVWCLRQVPLDEQLKELLKHKAFKDAEILAKEGQGESGGDLMKARLAVVHAEAGFLLLFDLHFEEAMDHFLLSDVMEPSELFPFFPTLTSRWRAMVPRKRYWGLHPPPQSMRTVIECGLLAIQSGLLEKSQVSDGPRAEDLFVSLKSGKDAVVERYLTKAMENVARYLRIIREKRDLKASEKEGVDTLLMKLYSELDASSELEELAASSNNCVLEEVESLLKGAGQLHTLALLYESKGMLGLALQVWQTLAHEPGSPDMSRSGRVTRQPVKRLSSEQAVSAREAVRLLEQLSDTDLVLQHINWIINLDQNLALNVLTSSKRTDPLLPEDILLVLESDGGMVQQRYLLWLVQEQGFKDAFYHTELALSLAKSAVSSLESSNVIGDKSESIATSSEWADQSQGLDQQSQLMQDTTNSPTTSATSGEPRDILLTFLETSDYYDAKTVLDVIHESKLWKEQFILHRKLGDEISALRTLALKLEDSEAAERYCAEIGRPEVYLELMDMYLHPGEGREPMHRAAVRLLHCHGASLDPLQVLEALSLEMPLASASETIAQLLVALVHRRRQGQIVRQLLRKDNLEARISRVEERSRHVSITADSTCGSCGARIGTKLFALYPDDSIFCYKCLRRFGENARPVAHRKSDKRALSTVFSQV